MQMHVCLKLLDATHMQIEEHIQNDYESFTYIRWSTLILEPNAVMEDAFEQLN